jgi:hypothetical protein
MKIIAKPEEKKAFKGVKVETECYESTIIEAVI